MLTIHNSLFIYSSALQGQGSHKKVQGNPVLTFYYSEVSKKKLYDHTVDVWYYYCTMLFKTMNLDAMHTYNVLSLQLGLHIFSYGSELFFVIVYLLYFSIGPSGTYINIY